MFIEVEFEIVKIIISTYFVILRDIEIDKKIQKFDLMTERIIHNVIKSARNWEKMKENWMCDEKKTNKNKWENFDVIFWLNN